MSELTAFQDAFSEALVGDFAVLRPWTSDDDAELRFSVYRNTVAKGCADALTANFPSVVRIVGEDWMRQAGVLFAREHPPARPSLLAYGEEFADWLAAFAPAAELPFLSDLARIDWAWRQAYFAADGPPLAPAAFAALAPELYGETRVGLHGAAQLLGFEAGVPSLWLALQGDVAPEAAELGAEPEGLLFARPGSQIEPHILGPGASAFLSACRGGESLAAAAEAALAADSGLALAEVFASLIAAGAFGRLVPVSEPIP